MPTARGWASIAASGAMLGAGAALRIAELLQVGVALLVLVLVQLARMHLVGRDFAVTRTIHPPKGVAGSPVTVEVAVSNRTGATPRQDALVYTDPVPQALGGARRMAFVPCPARPAGPGAPTTKATLRYTLTPPRRGRYAIGPGTLTATDPFGLVRSTDRAGSLSALVVFPRTEPLRGRAPAGARTTGSSTAATASLAAGSELCATREWRPGDDMRRIHWRSTARLGTIMVRQEELPRRDRATVVLDNRRSSYAEGWSGTAAFERAVEAAASLVHHFLGDGFAVRLVTTAGDARPSFGRGPVHHALLMTALATVVLAEPPGPLHTLGGSGSGDAGFLVVVGALPEAGDGKRFLSLLRDAEALVVLTAPEAHPEAARGLDRAGVAVVELPRGRSLAAAWHASPLGPPAGGGRPVRQSRPGRAS